MAHTPSRPEAPAGMPVQAAGAVLWRPGPDGPEVALIHRPRYDDWSLPKGKVDGDEHVLLTAVREVHEETGQRVVLGRRLPTISYRTVGGSKRVRYWAGRALTQSDANDAFQPNEEVDQLSWLRPQEALARLTRPLDGSVLAAFLSAPPDTLPIVLLRHGKAKSRSAEYHSDLVRPLAVRGYEQAETLVRPLSCYGPMRVISSPALRCLDTVRPFLRYQQANVEADQRTAMETEPALSEPAHAADPHRVASWINALIAHRKPAVVCSHREVLDEMLAGALAAAGLMESGTRRVTVSEPPEHARADDPFDAPLTVNGCPWSKGAADRLLGRDRSGGQLPPGHAWILHVASTADEARPEGAPRLVAVDRLKI